MPARINLHITPTRFHHASRILKITKSLQKLAYFDSTEIVALGDPDSQEHESIDDYRHVWRIPLSTFGMPAIGVRGVLRYFQWFIKILLTYRKENIVMINCHSLLDLPAGVLLKRFNSGIKYLIYDTHELETETKNLKGLFRKGAKWIERACIRTVDHVFVVSPSIEQWYRETYGLSNVTAIKNVPVNKFTDPTKVDNKFRRKFGIDSGELIYLYQGHLSYGRGIPLLLKAFSELSSDRHIIFMGYGPFEKEIREFSKRYSNIHFHEAVPPEEVLYYTVSADVGISLIENSCLSYYYSLPNKLYEYTLSRIPSIVSKFPDMSNFVDQIGAGWATEVNLSSFLNLLKGLDKEEIERHKKHLKQMDMKLGWQEEEKKMLAVYRNLLDI